MADDDVIILNQPGLKRRERSSGRVQFTVEVESEPLIHSFDPRTLAKGVAEAIAETLRQKVRGITAQASATTIKMRAAYAKAFASGSPGALKRYSGGRIGPMPPHQSDRAFNDSGRLAHSITATARDDSWTITMAANRLDPVTAGGEAAVRRIYERLVELVPAFAGGRELLQENAVQKAVVDSLGQMIVKARATRDQLTEARAMAAINAARQLLGALRTFAA
jgi:hypothetical protein